MAWIIMKSAGDDFSFVSWKVDGTLGHSYEYANELARKVTDSMSLTTDTEFMERILVYLENHEDEHDYREGWKSDQLKRDINELIDILGLPEERKQRIY